MSLTCYIQLRQAKLDSQFIVTARVQNLDFQEFFRFKIMCTIICYTDKSLEGKLRAVL